MRTDFIQRIEKYLYDAFNSPRTLWIIAITMLLVYIFPILFSGDDTEVIIFDGLDIVIPMSKVMAHSGMMFADSSAIVPNVMGGVPRAVLGSEYNIQLWLYYFFDDFTAYAIHEILMHVVGFLSMLLLLSRYVIPREHSYRNLVIFSASILFSIVPFYHGAGLSVPMLPLALYVFLQIRAHQSSWFEWMVLLLIPLYGNLILVYSFFMMSMGLLFLVDTIRYKKINYTFLLALALLAILFLATEYRLIYTMFIDKNYHSHREEFAMIQTLDGALNIYRQAHQCFLNGMQNATTYASVIIIPSMMLAMGLSTLRNRLSLVLSLTVTIVFIILFTINPVWIKMLTGNKYFLVALLLTSTLLFFKLKQYRLFYALILFQLFIAFLYGAWFSTDAASLGKYLPLINKYNFARIAFFQSTLWYIILALAFLIFTKKLRWAPLLILGIFTIQTISSIDSRQFKYPHSALTYHTYYAPELFQKVKDFIGKPVDTYRVGSLGFVPAISIYNGFYTIDGYLPNYPLEYKHKFAKVMSKALENHPEESKIFTEWGSKCYLFGGEINFFGYEKDKVYSDLMIDFSAFYELGGRYLLSSNRLNDKYLDQVVFLNKFTDENTFWQVYLYEVKPPIDTNVSIPSHAKTD